MRKERADNPRRKTEEPPRNTLHYGSVPVYTHQPANPFKWRSGGVKTKKERS
jgi:hypothetical protein